MGKKPLNEKQVKTLRKLVADKPLHSLLLNLGCDLMLRSSDLLKLKVSDVMNESGTPKTEVKVKQKKTGKTTLQFLWVRTPSRSSRNISQNDSSRISSSQDRWVTSQGNQLPLNNMPRSLRIGWGHWYWGCESVLNSLHSEIKPTLIYNQTKNVDAVRRLLGQSSVTATSAYLGTSDESSLDLARTINIWIWTNNQIIKNRWTERDDESWWTIQFLHFDSWTHYWNPCVPRNRSDLHLQ